MTHLVWDIICQDAHLLTKITIAYSEISCNFYNSLVFPLKNACHTNRTVGLFEYKSLPLMDPALPVELRQIWTSS